MSALVRVIAPPAAALVLLAAWAGGTAAGRPSASTTATRHCDISGQERKLGPTYVTSLRVRGVGCRTGKRVVRGYYRCRVRSGGRRGRCHSSVLGFSCSEHRIQSISTEFDARVTCRRGAARVWHDYTQFT
jgi:hypothetical protein